MLKHRERDSQDRERLRERDRDDRARRRERGADDDREPRRNREHRGSGANGHGSDARSARPRLPGSKAVERANAHLAELTRRVPEAVTALQRTRDGWRVVLEIVELQRIPRTTDIMASYAVDLDGSGDLLGYQRIARYYRSDVDGER